MSGLNENRIFNRDCGVLLHPTSLPTAYGIGDLGPVAHDWIRLLAESGQSLWQVLPLCPVGYAESPYQGLSAFASNPLLISPEGLYAWGLLSDEELSAACLPMGGDVDFAKVIPAKKATLEAAAKAFFSAGPEHAEWENYRSFVEREGSWLNCYALFQAIKESFGLVSWTEWPEPYRDRDPEALATAQAELADSINETRFAQFCLDSQWNSVREAAKEAGIRIVGDLPIFVAHDSADVWCNSDLFRLNADGSPAVVAGVPPDYFSATGQLWGNPLYAWDVHAEDDYLWWRQRMRRMLRIVDVVRIDHFRGFDAFWEIPGGADTAAGGQWVKAPGRELFKSFEREFSRPLPFIAEDLGVITPEVTALRDDFGLPGIRILQFAFGSDPMKDSFLPDNYDAGCVAYTGTHDNDTVIGWFNSESGSSTRSEKEVASEREAAMRYFNSDGFNIHNDFIRKLYRSDAGAALVPAQDLLGLGSSARMNTPGVASGSWCWRLNNFEGISRQLDALSQLTEASDRGLATANAESTV